MGTSKVFVLGMHRSGMSAIAGSLHAAGISAGADEELMPAGDDNRKGYFENLKLVRINEQLLQENDMTWDFVPPYSHRRLPLIVSPEIEGRITGLLQNQNVLVLKDPRLCITFPVWQRFCDNYSVVVPFRRARETAESLKKRNNFRNLQSQYLIQTYYYHLAHSIQKCRVHGVFYDDLLNSPNKVIASLIRWIQKEDKSQKTISDVSMSNSFGSFVDLSLRTHDSRNSEQTEDFAIMSDELLSDFAVITESFTCKPRQEASWLSDYFEIMNHQRQAERQLTYQSAILNQQLSDLNQQLLDVNQNFIDASSKCDELQRANGELSGDVRRLSKTLQNRDNQVLRLESYVDEIKSTLSWKITYPLRLVSGLVRQLLRKR